MAAGQGLGPIIISYTTPPTAAQAFLAISSLSQGPLVLTKHKVWRDICTSILLVLGGKRQVKPKIELP